MMARWSPPAEKTALISISQSGMPDIVTVFFAFLFASFTQGCTLAPLLRFQSQAHCAMEHFLV
jgi:hypothetical protein